MRILLASISLFALGCPASTPAPAPGPGPAVDPKPAGQPETGETPFYAEREGDGVSNDLRIELKIAEDGTWTATGSASTSGALSSEALDQLKAAIDAATIEAIQPEATCAALPGAQFTVSAKGKSARYVDQCGATPGQGLEALRLLARKLTIDAAGAPSAMVLEVWFNKMPRTAGSPPSSGGKLSFATIRFKAAPTELKAGGKTYKASGSGVTGIDEFDGDLDGTLTLADGSEVAVVLRKKTAH